MGQRATQEGTEETVTGAPPARPVDVALYFDASCRREQTRGSLITQCAWFVVVFGHTRLFAGGIVHSGKKKMNSSDAEWLALHAGLCWVKELKGISRLVIRGDAQGIINTLNSRKPGKDGTSVQCLRILEQMAVPFKARWIERSDNTLADQLSRGSAVDLAAIAAKVAPPVEFEAPVTPPPGNPAERERLIRGLAEYLWRAAGCPSGEDIHFWLEAEDLFRRAGGPLPSPIHNGDFA
jgi:ribonuclease HI